MGGSVVRAVSQARCALSGAVALIALSLLAGCSGTLTVESHPVALTHYPPTATVLPQWYRQPQSRVDLWESSPAITVDGERLFVVHPRGRVRALDAACGCRLWNRETAELTTGALGSGSGYLLLGTHKGELLALAVESGAERWRSEFSSEVMGRPLISNGTVVVRTGDGKMYGLNASNGERQWVYETTVPSLSLRGIGDPLIVGDTVYAGFSNGKVAALSVRDGKLLWDKVVAQAKGRSELERLVDVDAGLAYSDGVLYAVAFQGRLASLDAATGRIIWAREFSAHSGIALRGGQLFISDDEGQVWAVDRRTGATLWRQKKLMRRALTAPVIHNGAVVVGDYAGYLHWLSADDGTLLVRRHLDDEALVERPHVVEDLLYAVAHSGSITALKLGPQ